jgi:ketosteroid isomerase-like protein
MTHNFESMFASIDSMDVDDFSSHLSENVVFQFGNSSELSGRNNVAREVQKFFLSIKSLRHEMTGKWELGDTNILRFMTYYTRHDGLEVKIPCSVILHSYENALIDDYRIYIDLSPVYEPTQSLTHCLN